jgi:hypothetical protein
MKLFRIACLVAVSFAFLRNVSGQSFVNLNFEQSIVVSSNYDSEFGIYIGTANVLGWTGYLGANKETAILYNNFTLGNAGIDVVGQGVGAIEGQFTLVLQPGFDPFGSGQNVDASMSQTGRVPLYAQSLQFKASIFSSFSVSLGGQNLSLIPLGTGANYTLYGADISQFAGQVETLAITALAAPNSVDYFDSIVFSPSAVPEPSALSLFGICVLFFGWRLKRSNI